VNDVEAVTALVLAANVALLAPAATVTLAGPSRPRCCRSLGKTAAPPLGAGPISVTVPVEG